MIELEHRTLQGNMSANDFFKELDPVCQWKEDAMSLRESTFLTINKGSFRKDGTTR